MQNDIITKLSEHLSSHRFSSEVWTDLSIDMEAWIVYLFVQIRKILELQKTDRYQILRFYCSWVVHTKLDKNSQAKKIIKKTAKYLNDELNDEVTEILNFITLRKELNKFLQNNNLSNEITLSKNGEWFEFRKTLIQILQDQSLELTGSSDDSNVVKLTLVENKNVSSNMGNYFINFEATLISGETIEWSTLLGDYGGERKTRVKSENDEFWKRFLMKKGLLKYDNK